MRLLDQQVKELILEYEMLDTKQLSLLEDKVERTGDSLMDAVVMEGHMRDNELGQLIADRIGMPFVQLSQVGIPIDVLNIIPETVSRKSKAISYKLDDDALYIASPYTDNLELRYFLEKKMARKVQISFATSFSVENAALQYRKDIKKLFAELIEQYRKVSRETEDVDEDEEAFPIVQIVDNMIRYGYQNAASDIHIEPHESELVIRFRVDGILHDMARIPRDMMKVIITRIKIMAKMRTDEHMAAMDGKILFNSDHGTSDIRVSVIPITNGEKIVMRLMPEKMRQHVLAELGFSTHDTKIIESAIHKPYGMILATGPTGSGKTTTLYAILRELDSREVNIATIEDPVEYGMEGVNQIQVNPKTNLTFARGLRSILRQDPDIIMVGEIRDEETAKIAVNSAMTGHLVLSTLHTNDAATTLPRLIDMEIEPFLIASSVRIAIAQRLLRRICMQCIISYTISFNDIKKKFPDLNIERIIDKGTKEVRLYKGGGCHVCNHLGYKGRIGIFEILEIKENIRKLIMKHANSDEIRNVAIKENGMQPLQEDALSKAILGHTTLEEVQRVSVE